MLSRASGFHITPSPSARSLLQCLSSPAFLSALSNSADAVTHPHSPTGVFYFGLVWFGLRVTL